ncbi:MAG TPA: hypothetical protein DIU37_03015 [Opitutae bacterium]|nr:hypothetical protein [Opitutae bacterium]|tara:strand:+ start:869 stop:1585 length:717 start_codon:yes stop_codon:yes gene_type:complete
MNKLQKLCLGLLSLGIMSTGAWANMDNVGANIHDAGARVQEQAEALLGVEAKVEDYMAFIEERRATLKDMRALEQEKYNRLMMQAEDVKALMEESLPYKGTGLILENGLTTEVTLELGEEILGDIAKAKAGIQNGMQALTEAEAPLNEFSEVLEDLLLKCEALKEEADFAQGDLDALTILFSDLEGQFADLEMERGKLVEQFADLKMEREKMTEYLGTMTSTGLVALIVIGLLSCCFM